MLKIKIPLDFNQLSVVSTANLLQEKPYDLTIEKQNERFYFVVETDEQGLDIIHKVQDLLVFHGFDKDYEPTNFGLICEDLIDLFSKCGFS